LRSDGKVDYRALLESAPGISLVIARDLKVLAASDAYLRATMSERRQVVGRDLFDVLLGDPDNAAAMRAVMGRAFAGLPEGAPPPRKYDLRPRAARGAKDVDRIGQLEAAVAALTRARDQAEHASQLKTRFLGMVSHELRTPLTALSLHVDRLQRSSRDLDPRDDESLKRIACSAGRLREMIETLLEYARIEGGRVTTNSGPFDLGLMVARTVENHRFCAEQKGLAIGFALRAAPAVVVSDQRLVELVVSNLVDNAIKYTSAGAIEVTLSRGRDGAFRISVHDSGRGIPAEHQAEIFEPFQQLGPPSSEAPGIGLGLALARDIAGALCGQIELVSRAGEGSTFTLILPQKTGDKADAPA
jgi:signal transduction histidine kinase